MAAGLGFAWLLALVLGGVGWRHAAGKVTAVGAAVTVVVQPLASRDPPETELDGTWRGARWEGTDGKRDDLAAVGTRLIISGNKITYSSPRFLGGDTIDGLITADATQQPNTFDAGGSKAINIGGNPGSTWFYWTGIYQLEGETLMLCYVNRGEGERPREFKSNPATLLILQRERSSP